MRRASGAVFGFLAFLGVACQVLVSSEPPAFRCTGTGAGACPDGQKCATKLGECKPSCNEAACVAQGKHCDESTQTCAGSSPVGPDGTSSPDGDSASPAETGVDADLGYEPCVTSTSCASAICADSRLLGTDVGAKFCSKLCCKASDCGPTETCYAGGTGAKYCTPKKLLQLGASTGANKAGGAACNSPGECASGRCSNSRCVDTCCVNADCTNGTICRLVKPEATLPYAWYCDVAPGSATASPGDFCGGDNKCKSNLCEQGGCLGYCSKDSQCSAIGFDYCTLYKLDRTEDRFPFCVQQSFGAGPGQSCNNDSDCASSLCEATKCARVCQVDADCLAGQACRPRTTGTPLPRCVTK